MKKTIFAAAASLVAALTVAGCGAGKEAAEAAPAGEQINVIEDTAEAAPEKKEPGDIVWLGDSLTQGSLGEKDDNLANAPYEKLQKLVDVFVDGYGFYGDKTNEIFYMYLDVDRCNQEVDPNKTYIFWVGSNDWVWDGSANADTAPVIEKIDSFLAKGPVTNYIVIGTTSRIDIGDLYISINKDLEEHYKEHYMDVIDIINTYGYSEDQVHLSQASYDAVAEAVYEKLKALGYI